MPSSISTFPNEQFLTFIRGNYTDSSKYIIQANNLNTQWIYQIVKICYNVILEKSQLPGTKLNALLVIKDLMQTCQVPCLNLIQVYILPQVYKIAIQKPQQKGQRRGSSLFYNLSKSSKIPNVEEIGIKFVALCSQLLYAGSMIKTKKIFENFELKQKSEYVDYFEKYREYQIWGTPTSPESLKSFSRRFIQKGRQDFLRNLKTFNTTNNDYVQYFVSRIVQSLQTQANILLNNANQPLALQNDLDMRKLLKTCDPSISSPLVDQSLQKIKSSSNFLIRKNYLSLLTDFIKWGDAQAFMRVCQDNSFQKIGIDFYKSIQGRNGLNQGEKIYPEIKGQLQGKRKFYIQYLKSLQIIVNCLQNQKIFTQQTSDIKSLYNLLKNEKKYVFPQNLMAKKIQNQFHNNLQNNYQRNIQIMRRFQESVSSISKNSYRGSKNSMISAVSVLEKNIQNCLDDIQRLCLSEQDLQQRMKRLQSFKNQFQVQYQYLNQKSSILNKQQLHNFLSDGQQIARTINRIEVIYSQYQQKKINFIEFKNKYAKIIEQDSIKNSFSSDKHSSLNIKMSKQSGQQVISSYKPEKAKNFVNTNPNFHTQNYNMIKSSNEQYISRTQNGNKFVQSPMQMKSVNLVNKHNNMMINSQNEQINKNVDENNKSANNYHHNSQLNTSNLPKSSLVSKYDSFSQMLEEEGAKISRLSNKQKKQEYIGGKLSKISDVKRSQMDQRSSQSQRSSQRSSLIQLQAKKRQKQNSSKHQKAQFILSDKNSNSILPNSINNAIINPTNAQFILASPTNKNSNLIHGQKVQYIAPPSFRVPQSNQRVFANHFNRTVQTNAFVAPAQENYAATTQNFILNTLTNTQGRLGISSKQNKSNQMQEFLPKEIISNMRASNSVNTNRLQSERQSPKFFNTQGNFHQIINPPQIDTKSEYNHNQINREPQKVITNSGYIGSRIQRIPQYRSQSKQPKRIYTTQLNNYNQIFKVNEQNSNQSSRISHPNNPIDVAANKKSIQQRSNKLKESQVSQKFRSVMQKKSSNSARSQSKQNSQLSKAKSSKIEKSQQKKQSIMKEYYNQNKNKHSIIDEDIIKEPENHPANDSYYGIKDIENQVKNSPKPQFKYCFQLNKQYLGSNINPRAINNNYLQYGIKLGTQNKGSQLNGIIPDHESYLLSKIRRQYEKQQDVETKQLQNRVLQLKKDSSRLRNQIIYRQNQNKTPSSRSKSRRDYQSEVLSFSNSKSSKSSNNSPIALRPSQKQSMFSAFSSVVVPGVQIHDNSFERFLTDLNKQKLKKCCIKNKSLLMKNQACQVGYMFCHSQQSTKIILYFTPYCNVSNFSYSISKDPNLDVFSEYKGYSDIQENKQIKIQIFGIIKNIPYHLPLINIVFNKGLQQKNFSFYLPMTFNKFVEFNQVNINNIEKQLSDPQKIRRTSQFQLNPKVVKSQNLCEYFPNLTVISEDTKHRTTKYATKCTYKNNNFSLFLIKNGGKKMIIQGVPEKQPIPLQFLMSTIKKMFEKQR